MGFQYRYLGRVARDEGGFDPPRHMALLVDLERWLADVGWRFVSRTFDSIFEARKIRTATLIR
jgi:hypothetical protein